jgi:hypothetical protein
MKNRVVIFNKHGAHVLINPHNLEELAKKPNVIVNPDLSQVQGVPMHLWEQSGQSIIPSNKQIEQKIGIRSKFNKLHLSPYIVLSTLVINAINLYLLLKLTLHW